MCSDEKHDEWEMFPADEVAPSHTGCVLVSLNITLSVFQQTLEAILSYSSSEKGQTSAGGSFGCISLVLYK